MWFCPQIWCDMYEKVKRGAMAQTPCPGHSYSECRAYNSNNMCHHFQHGLAYRRGSVDGPVSFMNWSIIRARALGEGAHASVFSWAWHAVFQVSILAKSVWPKGQTTLLCEHIPLMFYPRCVRCENRLCERHWPDNLELDLALGRRAKIQKNRLAYLPFVPHRLGALRQRWWQGLGASLRRSSICCGFWFPLMTFFLPSISIDTNVRINRRHVHPPQKGKWY